SDSRAQSSTSVRSPSVGRARMSCSCRMVCSIDDGARNILIRFSMAVKRHFVMRSAAFSKQIVQHNAYTDPLDVRIVVDQALTVTVEILGEAAYAAPERERPLELHGALAGVGVAAQHQAPLVVAAAVDRRQ